MEGHFVVLSEQRSERRIDLDPLLVDKGRVTIGRVDCDINVAHPSVSAAHAYIVRENGDLYYYDTSRFGSWCGGVYPYDSHVHEASIKLHADTVIHLVKSEVPKICVQRQAPPPSVLKERFDAELHKERVAHKRVQEELYQEIEDLQAARKRAREEAHATEQKIREQCGLENELLAMDYNERVRALNTEMLGLRQELADAKRAEARASQARSDLVVKIAALLDAHDSAPATQADDVSSSQELAMGHDPDATVRDDDC